MVWVKPLNKMVFEQRLGEGVSHVDIWGRRIPITEKSQCKGPKVGTCLVFRAHKEASMAGGEGAKGEAWRIGTTAITRLNERR